MSVANLFGLAKSRVSALVEETARSPGSPDHAQRKTEIIELLHSYDAELHPEYTASLIRFLCEDVPITHENWTDVLVDEFKYLVSSSACMGVLQRAVSALVISGEPCAAQPTFVERMLERLQVLPLERCVLAACLITSEHAHISHQGKEAFSHAWRTVHKSSEDIKGEGQGVDLCAVGVVLNLLHWAPESHKDAVRDRMVLESTRESRIYAHNSIILADPSVNALLLLPDDDVSQSMQTLAGGPGLEMDIVPDADAPTPDVTSTSLVTIAGLMEEISYGCLQTREVWREVLQTLPQGAINGYSLAKAVSMMACTQSNLEDSLLLQTSLEQTGPQLFLQNSNSANTTPDPTTWDAQIFVDGIREIQPDLDWRDVIKGFDQPGVEFPHEQAVEFVVRLYRYATNGHNLPVETLVSPWYNNVPGQIAFLRLVVSNQSHCGVSLHSETSRYISDEGLMSPISEGPNRVWANVEVMECLLALAHSGYYNDVKELFSIPLKQCPDVLIFALVEAYPEWDTMQLDMCLRLLPVILANFPQTETLVLRLWKLREDMVLSAIADWYRREPNFIGRIVDIGNHLRALPTILDALPPRVAVDVGLKALGATDLQTWISERLKNPANQNAAIIFGQVLVRNILSRLSNATIAPKEVPPPETCRLVIDALTSAGTSPQTINEVHTACINVFPHHFQSQDPQQQQRQYMQKPSGMPQTTSLASVAATAVPFVPSPASTLPSSGNKGPQMNNNNNNNNQQQLQQQQQPQQQQQQQQQHLPPQQNAPGGARHLSQPAQTAASRQLAAAAQQAATDTQPIQPSQVSFSTDIEEEATSYFEKIYTGAMSITDLLNLLRNFNASPDRREQKVFDCMVHNLFDEYKFFHKYPDKELTMTSVVFGSLIQNHLLGFGACVIALRYILDALRQPPQTNMFKFGFCSLEQFQMRLNDWPHYCHAIAEIPHVRRVPELYAQVEKYASLPSPNPQNPNSGTNTGTGKSFEASPHLAATASPGVGGSGFGLTTNINTLLVASSGQGIAAPAQTVQEKVHFIFNNLSEINLTEKGEELMKWLHIDFFKWLSEYIVVKRASIEPNFHKLYLSFVQHIAVPDLLPMVRSSSISNIKILLGSEKISNSSSERSLLKNIGSWLGLITIGLDSPILLRDLPMKDLIVEGYHRRRLIFILPFIAKVLEAVKHSAVFSPPNPWTMGMLRLLCELHRLPALKLNLKFEIEVLYKNIAVDLDAIEPSDLLTPHPMDEAQMVPTAATALLLPRQHAQHQLQQAGQQQPPQQKNNTDSAKGMSKIDATNWQVPQMAVNNNNNNTNSNNNTANNNNTAGSIPAPPIGGSAQGVPGSQGAVTDTPMANMHLQVQLNSQCAYFVQLPQLSRRCIQLSIDQSIKEMGGVLERSVYYCCTASRELVLKDFAMDGDENRMRHAAQVMAQSLSINLALVTCKDPLRATLANHLRANFQQALQQANLNGSLSMEQQTIMVEQAVRFAVVENLELALSAIEKVAAGKTVAQIDESLQQAYAARRNHHDHQPNTPFYDIGYINNNNRYPAYLPDPLRAAPPGLRHHQYHVYEEFSKFGGDHKSRQGSLTSNGSPPPGTGGSYPSGSGNEPQSHENLSKPLLDPQSGDSQASQTSNAGNMLGLEKLMLVMAEIYKVISAAESAGAKCLADIPVSSNLFAFIRQASMVVMQDAKRAELALAVTYKITPPLFAIDAEKDNQIYKDVHVLLLQSLCDISKAVPRAVTSFYLGQLSLEAKLSPENVQTVAKLIRVRLLIDADMDSELAGYITENVNTSNDTANSKNNDTVADIMTALHSDKSLPASYTDISPAKMLRVAAALDRPRTVVQSDSVKAALEALREGYNRSESVSAHYMVSPETIVSIELLLDQCVRLGFHSQPLHTDMLYAHLVTLLQQQRMLKSDESAAMFIRLSVAVAVKATLKAPFRDVSDEEEERPVVSPTAADAANAGSMQLNSNTGNTTPTAVASVASKKESSGPKERYMNYMALDAVSKLFFILIKMAGGDPNTNAAAQKQLSLLNTALEVVVVAVLNDVGEGAAPRPGSAGAGAKSDSESKAIGSGRASGSDKSALYQRVYFRLIANLFRDLTQTDSLLDHIHPQILNGLASTLHLLQPSRIPRFAFAWLKLIAHRSFMPKLLLLKGQKGWPLYQKLLVELLVFMAPALKSCTMTAPMRVLYQGLLRILLILLHDFPELLCNYHFAFCDAIPASCIQVRNLILSAFPKNMRLPDPFTPNLKVDLLPEINQSPNLYGDYLAALEKNDFRRHLDQYLKTREVSFLMNLSQSVLLQSQAEIDAYGTKYDVPVINALVLYVGVQAIAQLQSKTQGASPITRSGPMDVFQQLIMDLDTEGRYFCLNAIANQLRYPNNHTHYFSCVLLFLFAEAQQEVIQEQITRVLVERLIVHRPHPWGLLITFIELIKNPRYRFWSHSFVYCASEIKDLFDSVRESVARSCMYTQKPPAESKEVAA